MKKIETGLFKDDGSWASGGGTGGGRGCKVGWWNRSGSKRRRWNRPGNKRLIRRNAGCRRRKDIMRQGKTLPKVRFVGKKIGIKIAEAPGVPLPGHWRKT